MSYNLWFMKKTLKLIILTLISWFVMHSFYVVYDGFDDNNGVADYALVLGTKVNVDGSLSDRLIARVSVAEKLYKDKKVNKIIVSGGLGSEGHYEGTKMKEYLVSKGVPDSLILVDDKGNNTRLSAQNLIEFKEINQNSRIIVVSQYFHVTRTKMLLRKEGFKNVEGVSPWFFEWRDFYALPREFLAFYTQL